MIAYELVLGLYFTVLAGDIVFAGQYKNGTLKNEVSFGLPRWRIYLGKMIAQMMTAVVMCFVMMVWYVALSALVLPADGTVSNYEALQEFGTLLLCALPVWLGTQSMVCACLFLIKGGTAAAITAVGIIALLPLGVELLGLLYGAYPFGETMLKVYTWLPSSMLERVSFHVADGDWAYAGKLCLTGGAWLVGSTALGLWRFTRKEIN